MDALFAADCGVIVNERLRTHAAVVFMRVRVFVSVRANLSLHIQTISLVFASCSRNSNSPYTHRALRMCWNHFAEIQFFKQALADFLLKRVPKRRVRHKHF